MKKVLVLLAVVLVASGFVLSAHAPTLTFDYTFEFSEGTPPEGPTPWLTATFDDTLDSYGANGVRLTMSAAGLTDRDFVTEWDFNVDPAFGNPASVLNVSFVDTSDIGGMAVGLGADAFSADGGGYYDITFIFPTTGQGGGAKRFMDGEEVVIDFYTLSTPIDVTLFDFLAPPHGGPRPVLAQLPL